MFRQSMSFVAVAITAACLAQACSSSSSGGASSTNADPFVGTWSCKGMSTTVITSPAGAPDVIEVTSTTVVITDDGKGNVTAALTVTDGGATCTLASTLSSDTKTLTATIPEMCTLANGDAVSYKSGTSTISADGASYTTSTTWSVTGTTSMGVAFTGSGTTTATCTKG